MWYFPLLVDLRLMEQDLVDHLKNTLPQLPDSSVDVLVHEYGLTTKDALTLLSFDDGDRLEYMMQVVEALARDTHRLEPDVPMSTLGKMAGNWYVANQGTWIRS